MATIKIFEIFDQFKKVHSSSRTKLLQYNNSKTLRDILYFTFHPDVHFYRTDMPPGYQPNNTDPIGLAPNNLYDESRKLYLFILNHPNSKFLTNRRRDELYIQFLEGLEAKEAQVVLNMAAKDLKVPGLTIDVVKEAFPNLLK